MTRILAAALFLAIVVLAFYVGRSTAATPRPAQSIPASAFVPVTGQVPGREPDPERTGAPSLATGAPTPEAVSSSRPPSGQPWHTAIASWYGPGLFGNRTACGQTLTPSLVGVASRTLRCGSRVTFEWAGRTVTAPVVDYGPAAWTGRTFDLTAGLCRLLGHCWTGPVEWRLA